MYLKKIEVAGFKSFADRTTLEFEPGLTAVVGPNGSGKSNITEAIRWVLGEQSAKSLRGARMPDIIFAGSAGRKALNVAEVTLVLDNTEKYLPIEFTEVSVTRRLYRNGDSEFYINKRPCRLKDIVDLFMDSGLGKESFSIISQGKVESIFNSKPEDRRGIFEEAAGVLKYKHQKKKAEQKLFETEDNIHRLQDIIYELETQLTPLRQQSANAEKYLLLTKEFKELDIGIITTELKTLKKDWEITKKELQQLQNLTAEYAEKLAQAKKHTVELTERKANLDQQNDHLQAELLQVSQSVEQAEGKKNVLEERSKNVEKSTLELNQSLIGLEKKITEYHERLSQLSDAQNEKNQQLTQLQQSINKLDKQLQLFSQSEKTQLADLRSQYIEVMQQKANINNDLKHLDTEYQREISKNNGSLARLEKLHETTAELNLQLSQYETAYTDKIQKIADLKTQYEQEKLQLQKIEEQLSLKEKQLYNALGVLQQARARQKSLQEVQANYSGFYQGVRAILQAKNELNGIIGAVLELVQVPEKLSLALDTALGASGQHIVVTDEKAARRSIAYLKQKHAGRATFLPLTVIKPRSLPIEIKNQLTQEIGYVGIASECITYDSKLSAVITNLLGTTILATDLESANHLAHLLHYRYRIVSLEGDVMNPGGSMTGGANKRKGGTHFAQANELDSLGQQIIQMDQRLQQVEKQVASLKEHRNRSVQQIDELRERVETEKLAEKEIYAQQQLIQSKVEQSQKEQKATDYETQAVSRFLIEYQKSKSDLTAKKNQLEQELQGLNTSIELANSNADETLKQQTALKEEYNQHKQQQAVIQEQLTNIQQVILEKQEQLTEICNQKADVLEQIDLLTSNSSEHSVSKTDLMTTVDQLKLKQQAIMAQTNRILELREQSQHALTVQNDQLNQIEAKHQTIFQQMTTKEVENSRLELKIDQQLEYLQSEYHRTYEGLAVEYSLSTSMLEAKEKRQLVKQAIKQLGNINIQAIEQFQEVNERYQFLTSQRDDLLVAKNELFTTMNEMDEEVKQRFNSVFLEIKERFAIIFPEMFGGGYARLYLTNPDDLLNTGIEIEAQPPGKKLQSLSLLSGGERALTAITLLFAIIQVRPVPFCVLDEVEAALDEANVARFGHYLRHFDDQTQFIVITHRKGTMESADVLYGVTMEESGVSKLVTVKLEEISDKGEIHLSKMKS